MTPHVEKGRAVGVVVRTSTREKGFIFVTDAESQEYFAHVSSFADRVWFQHVEEGDGVSFRISKTPKGKRAFDVRPASVHEQEQIAAMEEQRGNR